ncbi:Esa1p-associated factor, partial [Quaeritorhiza haematococci]
MTAPSSSTAVADPAAAAVAGSSGGGGSSSSSGNSRDKRLAFEDNEKILCFHGPLLYEAKVLKGEYWEGKEDEAQNGAHYFVHYKGWKQTWDEWVPESRTLKFNDENLKKQADLRESYMTKKTKFDRRASG